MHWTVYFEFVINRTSRARVPVLGLALLATPTALSANSATTAIP